MKDFYKKIRRKWLIAVVSLGLSILPCYVFAGASSPHYVRTYESRGTATTGIYRDVSRPEVAPIEHVSVTQKGFSLPAGCPQGKADYIERVQTPAGLVIVCMQDSAQFDLWLDGSKVFSSEYLRIMQVLPEKDGAPDIVIVHSGMDNKWMTGHEELHIVDMGAVPPFFDPKGFSVLLKYPRYRNDVKGKMPGYAHLKNEVKLKITRQGKYAFLFSGKAFDRDDSPAMHDVAYRYDRLAGTVTRVK